MNENGSLAANLDAAIGELSARGLVWAAKWAAEAAIGTQASYEPRGFPKMHPTTTLAKTYFDLREYARCAHHLKTPKDSVGWFLKFYSKYLYGEKRRERLEPSSFEMQQKSAANPFLLEILKGIDLAMTEDSELAKDPFLLYLKGVIYLRKSRPTDASAELLKSLVAFPYNWSAWQELVKTAKGHGDIEGYYSTLNYVPDRSMLLLFKLYAHQQFWGSEAKARGMLRDAEKLFPQFAFIQVQKALLYYHESNHEAACKIVESIIKTDTFRLEELELYSNILYITGQTTDLSILADMAEKIDMYRPETCCLIANYFGLKGEHERAVSYYHRALVANREHSPAWTLLGHEYIELKNTNAAIQAYLNAVKIDRLDYNAWYGLGQAFEVVNELISSLYHYKKALALRPNDTRIWAAVADSYQRMEKFTDAISAYEQALAISPAEAYFSFKLGILYEQAGDMATASRFMSSTAMSGNEDELRWKGQASMWLAREAMRAGNWSEARNRAVMVAEEGLFETSLEEEARAIVREASNRLKANM